eukprot:g17864.t1
MGVFLFFWGPPCFSHPTSDHLHLLCHSATPPQTAEDGATPTDFLGAAAEQLATVMESFESMMAQGIDLIREEEKPAPSKAA